MVEQHQIQTAETPVVDPEESRGRQSGNGSDYFADGDVRPVGEKAGHMSSGTDDLEKPVVKDVEDEIDDEVTDLIDPDSLVLKDPLNKTRMREMSKGQLMDYIVQLQSCYLTLFREYLILVERSRKDQSLTFMSNSDSMRTLGRIRDRKKVEQEMNPHKQPKPDGDGHDGQDGSEGKGNGQGNGNNNGDHPKREYKPKKGPHQVEKRGNMPCLEVNVDFPVGQLNELKARGFQYHDIKCYEEMQPMPFTTYLVRYRVLRYRHPETGEIVQVSYAKDLKYQPGSLVSSDLLAYWADEYYIGCTPANRIAKKCLKEGAPIQRQYIYKQLRDNGKACIHPIALRMSELLLMRKSLQSDETYARSIEEMVENGRKFCYFWLVRSSELDKDNPPILVMRFVRSRSSAELEAILKDFEGAIECDGFSAYPALKNRIERIIIACCLQHVRHGFMLAFKAVPNTSRLSKEELDQIPPMHVINKIDEIFALEKTVKNSDVETRRQVRMGSMLKLADTLFDTIKGYQSDPTFDPRSLFGKAVTYALNRKSYIMTAIKHPELPIHNSACERGFVPVSIFRNNIKSFATNQGADTAADYWTVGQTCDANGENTKLYFAFLYENVPAAIQAHAEEFAKGDLSFLDELMPWGEKFKNYQLERAAKAHTFMERFFPNAKGHVVSCA